ncbi:MAG: rod-binding protein [Planctomycetes bacterium]|nr:rod-binding protein [Planctomycetota bacterium]
MIDGIGSTILPTDRLGLEVGRLRVPDADAPREEVKKVAEQLEGVFFSMMVKEMRKSLTDESLFGDGPEAEQYSGLFDQMMGEQMSRSGGLGIARLVMDQAEARAKSIAPEALSARLAEIAEEKVREAGREEAS